MDRPEAQRVESRTSMSSRAVDPRPERTRQAIYSAIKTLSGEPEPEPTVHRIITLAGVSRSAFYAQFSGIDDAYTHMLADTFVKIADHDAVLRRTGELSPRKVASIALNQLIEHMSEYRGIYQSLITWNLGWKAVQLLVETYADQVRATAEQFDTIPPDLDLADAALFIGGGQVALLFSWVAAENPEPPSRLVERMLAILPAWLIGPAEIDSLHSDSAR